jgi:aminopeptidase N
MALLDPHSYADDAQPVTKEIELDLGFNFRDRTLSGSVTLHLDRPAEGCLDLDSRGFTILACTDRRGSACNYEVGPNDPIKGQRLRIALFDQIAVIGFVTNPEATALQWLEPGQTAGGRLPYVYTQCQPTHARSIFPCQDTPRVRVRYKAKLNVPSDLRAVMAARHVGRQDLEDGRAVERFEMDQPIPPYLFAFAVGDLAHREIAPRSRVYAEPLVVDAAAHEFAEVDRMISRAEALFGPYDWERFDVLVMPPSFPYGGMENPRLTFVTPTLLAGDRSLVGVVAHELAHSWTGNLVTNASMNDFWLNEGFTTYAERRIIEALDGESRLSLEFALGRKGLESDLVRFRDRPHVTRLRNDLTGIDPDEVFSRVPYEKGYLFLLRIEQEVGRPAFDRFLKSYIAQFRFQSITTDDFLRHLRSELPAATQKIDLAAWLDQPGLPDDAPIAHSERLDQVEALVATFQRDGRLLSATEAASFGPLEWQVYLAGLPRRLDGAVCTEIDRRFDLSSSKNAEIRTQWLTIAAASDHEPAFSAIEQTLTGVGRLKYLRPLYIGLLGGSPRTRALAQAIFQKARPAYHPMSRAMVEALLAARSVPQA